MEIVPEQIVQEIVASQLPSIYYGSNSCFVDTEVETKVSKRADVLIGYRKKSNRPYLIAVEAKSRLTLSDLKPTDNFERRLLVSRLVVLLLFSLGVIYLGYKFSLEGMSIILLLFIFVLAVIGVSLLLKRLNIAVAKAIPAIKQLDRYPANEKWIAIPYDTFVNRKDFDILLRACKKNGIGLLEFNKRERLVRHVRPVPIHENNSYVNEYKEAAAILDYIRSCRVYGTSPSEIWKVVSQSLRVVGLSVISLFAYFVMVDDANLVVVKSIKESSEIQLGQMRTDEPELHDRENSVSAETENSIHPTDSYSIPEQECTSLRRNSGRYIIVDQICSSIEVASKRAQNLRMIGYPNAGYLKADCFDSWISDGYFITFTDKFYDSEYETSEEAQILRELLKQHQLEVKYDKPMLIRVEN